MRHMKENRFTSHLLCLVLNRMFLPFDVIPWQRAITLEIMGRCLPLEHHPTRRIKSVKREWEVPIVIKVNSIHYSSVSKTPTRMMIYYRDGFRCAYCGKVLRDNELTIDHVVPKAKGGKWTWENLVTCCRECNIRKKEEIWMPRFATPSKPKFLFPKYVKARRQVDETTRSIWERYIPEGMAKALAL